MTPLIHDRSLRGRTKTGWPESHHTFSFGGFSDPGRMAHRALRAIHEDVVIPGAGLQFEATSKCQISAVTDAQLLLFDPN